ncbi:hypothetical protein ACWTU6_23765 [Mesorhizobium sp. BHbsci]
MRVILVALFLILVLQIAAADPPQHSSFATENGDDKSPEEQVVQTQAAKQIPVDANSASPTSSTTEEHILGSAKHDEPTNNGVFWGDGLAQWLMAVTGMIAALISGWAVWLLRATLLATNKTAEAASDNTRALVAAERPHVRLFRTIKRVNKSGEVIAVDGVNFRNYGRTPALVKSLAIEYVLAQKPPSPYDCKTRRSYPDDSVMAQDEGWPRNHYVPQMDNRPKLSELLPSHGKNGLRLFVYGEIIYSDAFGEERRTGFCREFDGRNFTYNQSDINADKCLNYAT